MNGTEEAARAVEAYSTKWKVIAVAVAAAGIGLFLSAFII